MSFFGFAILSIALIMVAIVAGTSHLAEYSCNMENASIAYNNIVALESFSYMESSFLANYKGSNASACEAITIAAKIDAISVSCHSRYIEIRSDSRPYAYTYLQRG